MFPLRSLPVHVASVGGGDVLCLIDFVRQARLSVWVSAYLLVRPAGWLAGWLAGGQGRAVHGSGERLSIAPSRTVVLNYCNPARGASDRWMMTIFRSAGAGVGGSGAQMQVF